MSPESKKKGAGKDLSRRNFLKKSMIGGAAAAVYSVAPAFVRNARSSSGSLENITKISCIYINISPISLIYHKRKTIFCCFSYYRESSFKLPF